MPLTKKYKAIIKKLAAPILEKGIVLQKRKGAENTSKLVKNSDVDCLKNNFKSEKKKNRDIEHIIGIITYEYWGAINELIANCIISKCPFKP